MTYKAGRNEPCPCGSGNKFKHCHGALNAVAAGTPDAAGGRDHPRLRLFVVYHQKLHASMYAGLSRSNLAKLTFYKVNEAIPFEVGLPDERIDVVKEYELPQYDPFFQAQAFNEGSCMIHAWRNRLFENSDYVGIVQYDMRISDDHLAYWRELMAAGADIIAVPGSGPVAPEFYDRDYIREAPFYGFPMAYVVERLCRYLGVGRADFIRRMTQKCAAGEPLCLLNSFIIRTGLFVELAAWISEISRDLYDYTMTQPSHARHHGHMGGIIERSVGLFLIYKVGDGQRIHDLGAEHTPIAESHRTRYGQQ